MGSSETWCSSLKISMLEDELQTHYYHCCSLHACVNSTLCVFCHALFRYDRTWKPWDRMLILHTWRTYKFVSRLPHKHFEMARLHSSALGLKKNVLAKFETFLACCTSAERWSNHSILALDYGVTRKRRCVTNKYCFLAFMDVIGTVRLATSHLCPSFQFISDQMSLAYMLRLYWDSMSPSAWWLAWKDLYYAPPPSNFWPDFDCLGTLNALIATEARPRDTKEREQQWWSIEEWW